MSVMRKFQRLAKRNKMQYAHQMVENAPKPPVVDGVCACGCCHVPDRGACPKYIAGSNHRCVLCDHSVLCHRRKGEPPPKMWNMPTVWHPDLDKFKPNGFKTPYKVCNVCRAPAIFCPHCRTPIPIKEVIEDNHTGTCPKCGAVDVKCPGEPKPKEQNEPAKPIDETAGTADPATAVD